MATEQGKRGDVVAFVSQKGGVGKSTLSRGLAREAAKAGLRVKIADLDTQQGTSVAWQRRRLADGIEPRVWVESFATAEQALEEATRFDLLIIDAPARASKGTEQIARAASLIIQPTDPCLDDLEPAVKVFHELAKAGISKQKLAFAINKVLTPSEETSARSYLTEAGYAVLDGLFADENVLPRRPRSWAIHHRNPLRRPERPSGRAHSNHHRQDSDPWLISRAAPSVVLAPLRRLSETSGILAAPEVAPAAPAAHGARPAGRKTRKKTGRTVLFSTRVSADFDREFRATAERDNLLLTRLLELAFDAYRKQRGA